MQWYLMTILIYYEKHVVQINLTKKEEKKKKLYVLLYSFPLISLNY